MANEVDTSETELLLKYAGKGGYSFYDPITIDKITGDNGMTGIALRIPLLMYGGADAGDPKEDLTVDNFTRKIKDESWAEFMPICSSASILNCS